MLTSDTVNSREYWDRRFAEGDWENRGGRQQTSFFAQVALELFPEWLSREIESEKLSICDAGCAMGEGTNLLASQFSQSPVVGIDFSQPAILAARQHYRNARFAVADVLQFHEPHDVVFSSNTLEHFDDPAKVMENLAANARRYVAVLVPFEETEREAEHQVTFTFDLIPVTIGTDFVLLHHRVADLRGRAFTYWGGKQILLVYGRKSRLMREMASPGPQNGHRSGAPAPESAMEALAALSLRHDAMEEQLAEARESLRLARQGTTEAETRLGESEKNLAAREQALAESQRGWAATKTEAQEAAAERSRMALENQRLARHLAAQEQALLQMRESLAQSREALAAEQATARERAELLKRAWLERDEALAGQHERLAAAQAESARTVVAQHQQLAAARAQSAQAAAAEHAHAEQCRADEMAHLRETLAVVRSLLAHQIDAGERLRQSYALQRQTYAEVLQIPKGFRHRLKRLLISMLRLMYRGLPVSRSLRERLKDRYYALHLKLFPNSTLVKRYVEAVKARQPAPPAPLPPPEPSATAADAIPHTPAPAYVPGTSNLPLVAIHLDSFDRGGLEEIALMLTRAVHHSGTHRVVVLVTGSHVGYLGQAARAEGIPVLTLYNDPANLRRAINQLGIALVNLHYTLFGAELYAQLNVPTVYTVHNTYIWADEAMVRERSGLYARMDAFIAVSEPVRDFFARRFSIPPERINVIPNGVDLEQLAQAQTIRRAEVGLADEDLVFISVATFNWHKAHLLMVAAMERLVHEFPRARLLFVGNTHEQQCRDAVVEEIARRGLDACVRILDFQPKPRVAGLMRLADFFLQPSLIEGWSVAATEAMACGLPLILTDIASARTVIENSDIGIIVPNPYRDIHALTTEVVRTQFTRAEQFDNLEALIDAMRRMCRDHKAWKHRGLAGKEKISSRYTSAHSCAAAMKCFNAVLGRKAGSR